MKPLHVIVLLCLVPIALSLTASAAGLVIGLAAHKRKTPEVVIRYVSPEEARALREAGQEVLPQPTAK